MGGKRLRDLIILLPGIMGSALQKNGRDLWALSGQAAWRALNTWGSSLQELRLEGQDPGQITATRLLSDAHIIPGLIKVDGYSATARMIVDTFNVVPGSVHDDRSANFIEFPYDWRLDNRLSAQRLKSLVDDRLKRWRDFSGEGDARVILIAHSMGGLVARYYLEALEGWPYCRALITFGTPYRGSPNALNFLANGYKKLFLDLTEALRSFPSVHQLLPIYPCVAVDGRYVRVTEAGTLPGVDPHLAADALAFHREIEAKVNEHCSSEDYLRNRYTIMPIVGTVQPTMQSATFDGHAVKIFADLPPIIDSLLAEGDGTVPRASAIPIELSNSDRATFVPEHHGSLQCNLSVLNDVRGRLEQMQAVGLDAVRAPGKEPIAPEGSGIALSLEDLYTADEPVTICARTVNARVETSPLRALIEAIDAPENASRELVQGLDEKNGWSFNLVGLSPGLYRVQIRASEEGPFAPPPVQDLFEIAT
jgi:pimeloyl-ACP methyl ester carboxylesterase